jgi:hypothetical protein
MTKEGMAEDSRGILREKWRTLRPSLVKIMTVMVHLFIVYEML